MTVHISLPPSRYSTSQKKTFFFEELCRHLEAVPSLRGAATALVLPMMGYPGTPVQDATPPLKLNERLIAKIFPVSPRYFGTLEMALKRGRELSERDSEEAERVAIIDESLTRHFWPGYPEHQNPIGRHLLIGGVNLKPVEIVRVLGDVHQNLDSRTDWRESVYVALTQNARGVVAYSVARHNQEMGIRQALGAQRRDILRLIFGQGVVLAMIGVGTGLGASIALTRVMTALLFHVSPTDLITFAAIAAFFLIVAIAACYMPTLRATRIDPIAALRI